jgi:hypothetical protein
MPTEPTATPLPTDDAPQPTIAAAQPASDVQTQPNSSEGGYVVFGGIAAGLIGLLVFVMRRRR